ncbi:hypothetical protein SBA6_1200007 [Candidatus Sulfopaludibacter sp. SbA6]|nr:hypothetical protein SBA6_1200007 [Candidatus Sulfopaludibacter sp. SbA6]
MSRRVIKDPVGEKGRNEWLDTRTVQELLLFVPIVEGGPAMLAVDGICGPKTKQAIRNFQLKQFGPAHTDGKVDTDKRTFQKLKEYESQNGIFDFSICRLEYSPLPEPRTFKPPDRFYLIEDGNNATIYCWTAQGKPKPDTIDIMKAQSSRQRFRFKTSEPRNSLLFQTQFCLHSEVTGDIDGGSLDRAHFWLTNDQNWELVSVNWYHKWASPAARAYVTPQERGIFHIVKS